jgi:hypothetical protein
VSGGFWDLETRKVLLDTGENCIEWNLAAIVEWAGLRVFHFELFADCLIVDGKCTALCNILIQRFEALLLVLQVFWGTYEFLHGLHVEKLMNVVVVSEEIRWDFPRPFELAVFSNHSLDLFHESVFGVVTTDIGSSVVGVLKLLGLCELGDPGGNGNRAVRSRLIEASLQKNSILETSD